METQTENPSIEIFPAPGKPASTGTPQSVFEHPDVQAASLVFHWPCAYHGSLLKRINHPLAETVSYPQRFLGDRPSTEAEQRATLTHEEAIEFIFTFCQPLPDLRELVGYGPDAYREEALSSIADVLPLALITRMETEIAECLSKVFNCLNSILQQETKSKYAKYGPSKSK